MGRKPSKAGMPKVRHGWEINPKTRVGPLKKSEPVVCTICGGFGTIFAVNGNAEGTHDEDCMGCGGTGYAD